MSTGIVGNRYELLEKIGSGGMAIVYKARCRLLNRFVAIKMLRAEFNEDAEFLKRFETEAQAAASLSHPNIVSVYDVGIHNKLHYIVMEYVEGTTLKEYLLNNGPLPIEKIVDFSGQISSALEHAHAKKIIHHDIKPHNIIITEQGLLKVTDFGLARAVSASTTIAAAGAIGSVHYASPEQARGGFTDEKSDIYSLGVTMYEMTTGRVPFDGETPVSVAIKHLQKDPTPPSAIVPDVPASLENIILKAMEKEPLKRYQSAIEVTAALRGVFDISAVAAKSIAEQEDNESTRRMPSADEISKEEKRLSEEKSENAEVAEEVRVVKREKNLKEESPKRKKEDTVAIVAAIATTVVIVAVLAAIMVNILGGAMAGGKIEAPDFVGMTIEEAEKIAEENSVKVSVKEYEYNEEVDEDKIISQSPESGSEIKKNSEILVIVSRGGEYIVLGDYKNDTVEDTKSSLKKLKIDYEVLEVFDDEVEEGKVVKTEPKAKSKVSEGSSVTIYVSKGPEKEETVAPDLIGTTVENAKILLANRGLELGAVTEIESSKPKGTVVQQSPVAGNTVEEGKKVNLVISSGPKSTPEPSHTPEPTPSSAPETSEPVADEQ